MVISQGDVCWAEPPEPTGSRPGFRRPVVVVQGDALNRSLLATAVCVPLTSNLRWARAPGNVLLDAAMTGLPKGMQAGVFGDLQKIRNDILKNGAVAANGAEGKCEILKWFRAGEPIIFKLDHVIEFLNLIALLPNKNLLFTDNDGKARMTLAWHPQENQTAPPWRNHPYRVVSANPFIDRVDRANPESDHGLFVRLAFADGLTWAVLAAQSEDLDHLLEKKRAIEAAPAVRPFGLPQHPDLLLDVSATHARAKASLSHGPYYRVPPGVGPAMQYRSKPQSTI